MAAAAAVAVVCGQWCAPALAVTHPRIFLDANTLTALRQRAEQPSAQWQALKDRCDLYLTGVVNWPDGSDYPPSQDVGPGYQGDGYIGPLLNSALCYRVALGLPDVPAATVDAYGAKVADILTKMSEPYTGGDGEAVGSNMADSDGDGDAGNPTDGDTDNDYNGHVAEPLTDVGYGVRNYVVGMALAYDWAYDALSPTLRTRVVTAINRWIDAYENGDPFVPTGAFELDFAQGNYAAGYYAAKAYDALATEGDNADASGQWSGNPDAFMERVHNGLIQPYYAANLSGGGWPEGWNYGQPAVPNQSLPVLAAQTAGKGDLVQANGASPFVFPVNTPRLLVYLTWPDLKTFDDSDFLYASDAPSGVRPSFVDMEAGLLEGLGDPFAPYFQSFAAATRAAGGGPGTADSDLWPDFLFWNPDAAQQDYKTLPLSHYAPGLEDVVMRSSWETNAVWAFTEAGPYINYNQNGEEFFDKGSVAIVNGANPFLVNAPGALVRNTPGTNDGSLYETPIDDDLFYNNPRNREIFNLFYTALPSPEGQGPYARADGSTAGISRYEDGGGYAIARDDHLESQYPQDSGATPTITSWTRDITFVRPDIVVLYDRTSITDAGIDQWLAFHFRAQPAPVAGQASGITRYDIGSGPSYAGSVDNVLPDGHTETTVDVFRNTPDCEDGTPSDCGGKVFRLEVRPGAGATSERWLTVFDAASSPSTAVAAARIQVDVGNYDGVLLTGGDVNRAVLSCSTGSPAAGHLRYWIPAARTDSVVNDLLPSTNYAVTATVNGSSQAIDLVPQVDGGFTSTASGVLYLRASNGVVTLPPAYVPPPAGQPPQSGGGGSGSQLPQPSTSTSTTSAGAGPASAPVGPPVVSNIRIAPSQRGPRVVADMTLGFNGTALQAVVTLAGRAAKTLKLATALRRALPAGHYHLVVRLGKAGKRLLARRGRLKVILRLAVSAPEQATVRFSQPVRLRR